MTQICIKALTDSMNAGYDGSVICQVDLLHRCISHESIFTIAPAHDG